MTPGEGNALVIAVEYHHDLKEVQSDQALSSLLSADCQHSPFDRLAWWQGLAEHCGMEPTLAVARNGRGLAVLPLTGANGHLQALSNWYTFRYRPVANEAQAEALIAAIAKDLAGKAHRVTLSGLPDEDGTATVLETAFRNAGWSVSREESDTNHVLEVMGRSYEEFLAGRPGKLRTTLKRKTPKVATQVLTSFDAGVWDTYEDIYRESWKPDEGSPAFLRAFAEAEGQAGRLRLAIAHGKTGDFEGRALAAQMWTVEGGTAHIHKLAHREDAKPVSPGSVLSAALFRHVIDIDKVGLIDFGTGDDPYKRDWMEQQRPRYRLDMFRPFSPRNWLVFARAGLLRLAGSRKRG